MVEMIEKAMPWPETPSQRNVREMGQSLQSLTKSLKGKSEKALERWASRFEKIKEQKELLSLAKVYFSETSPGKRKALLSETVTRTTGLKGEAADKLGADLSQIWELSAKNLARDLTPEEEKELRLLIWNLPVEERFRRVATNLAFASVGEIRAKLGRLIIRRRGVSAETPPPPRRPKEEEEEERKGKPRSAAEIAAQMGAAVRARLKGETEKIETFGKTGRKPAEKWEIAKDWASGWWPYVTGGTVVVTLLVALGLGLREAGERVVIPRGHRAFLPPEQQKAEQIEDQIKEEMPEIKRLPPGMGETYVKDREQIRTYFFDEEKIEGYRMTDLIESLRKMSDVRRFVYFEALKDEVGDRTRDEVTEELEKSGYSTEEIEQFWDLSQLKKPEDLAEFIEKYRK